MLGGIGVVARNGVGDVLAFLGERVFCASVEQLKLNAILCGLHLAVSHG